MYGLFLSPFDLALVEIDHLRDSVEYRRMCGPSSALTSMPGMSRTSGRIRCAFDGSGRRVVVRDCQAHPFLLCQRQGGPNLCLRVGVVRMKVHVGRVKARFPDVVDQRPFEADLLEDPVALHSCLGRTSSPLN